MLDTLDLPIPKIIETVSVAELATIQDQLARATEQLKQRKDVFEAVLTRKFGGAAKLAYQAAQKDTGTVHVPATNILTLKVEVDKTVKWDQKQLYTIFSAMKPEDAAHYAKVKYEVAEAKFQNAPPEVAKQLSAARTVVPGKMKFTFSQVEIVDEQQEAA